MEFGELRNACMRRHFSGVKRFVHVGILIDVKCNMLKLMKIYSWKVSAR